MYFYFRFLRLATEQHSTLPQKGGINGKVYLLNKMNNFHELKTHTLVEVVEELLRGVKGFWWVGFLTISKYFIKYIA